MREKDNGTYKVATLNVNGIRSSIRNGFWDWFYQEEPDVLCLQEVRMSQEDFEKNIGLPDGYNFVQSDAVKKGYSGVAIWSRLEIERNYEHISISGMEWADEEGRCVGVRINDVDIWSMYFPSGTSGAQRQFFKDDFLNKIIEWMSQRKSYKTLICGDFNIAHTALDLFHDKANANKPGFFPHERKWMTERISEGWNDVWRTYNPNIEEYSWWSSRSKMARDKNVGWRIDYQLASPSLVSDVISAKIQGPQPKISDHAPVIVTYSMS